MNNGYENIYRAISHVDVGIYYDDRSHDIYCKGIHTLGILGLMCNALYLE